MRYMTACGEERSESYPYEESRLVLRPNYKGFVINPGCEDCPNARVNVWSIGASATEKLISDGMRIIPNGNDFEELLLQYQKIFDPVSGECDREPVTESDILVINAVKAIYHSVRSGKEMPVETIAEALSVCKAETQSKQSVNWVYPEEYTSERIIAQRSQIADAIIALANDSNDAEGRLFSLLDYDMATEITGIKNTIGEVSIATTDNPFQQKLF